MFGWSIKEKFINLNPNDGTGISELLFKTFPILTNPTWSGAMNGARRNTSTIERYELIKKFIENNGGTLRVGKDDKLIYAPEIIKNKSSRNNFTGRE